MPLMICLRSEATFARICFLSFPVSFGLILPSATPLFFRLNVRFVPPLNLPVFAALTAS